MLRQVMRSSSQYSQKKAIVDRASEHEIADSEVAIVNELNESRLESRHEKSNDSYNKPPRV